MKHEMTLFHTMEPNRKVFFQTHLLFVTIYGPMWSSFNIRWCSCAPMCHCIGFATSLYLVMHLDFETLKLRCLSIKFTFLQRAKMDRFCRNIIEPDIWDHCFNHYLTSFHLKKISCTVIWVFQTFLHILLTRKIYKMIKIVTHSEQLEIRTTIYWILVKT